MDLEGGCTYLNLWQRFYQEEGCLQTVSKLLPKWHAWALQYQDLSDIKRLMAWGPTLSALPHSGGSRAIIGGQAFSSAKKQSLSKAFVVMVRRMPQGLVQFRVVQHFYKFRPPWVRPQAGAQTVNVADIRLLKDVGQNRKLDNVPEVLKDLWDDPNGNLQWCEGIVPTPIALVPHLSGEDRWKDMHPDPDFLSREY